MLSFGRLVGWLTTKLWQHFDMADRLSLRVGLVRFRMLLVDRVFEDAGVSLGCA